MLQILVGLYYGKFKGFEISLTNKGQIRNQNSIFCITNFLFNSREAIAAIIGKILVFCILQELDCVGALSFLQLEEFELYWCAVF